MTIKIILLIFVSSNFISCNGLVNSKNNSTELKTVETGKIVKELDNQIWVVFQDAAKNYWFGSNGKGIYKYNGKTLMQFTTVDGLVDNQIRGIQEDKAGNLYFETPKGISKYNGTKFNTLEVIKSPNNKWKLETNNLWFGYNANDLYRYDGISLFELKLPRKNLNKAFENETEGVAFESNNYSPYAVYGVDKDKDGNMWFGTVTAGAFRYDGKSFIWFGEKELSTLPDGRVPGVRSIIQDKDDYFWLSNFYSKYKINPNLPNGYEKLKAVELPKDMAKDKILYFNAGLSDDEGNLWMTTYSGGVWKYDGKTLSNTTLNNGNEELLLICIYQDQSGTIWLGTNNDGVYKQIGNHFEKFEPNKY